MTIETSAPTERLFVSQEIFMTTVITTHTGKPVVQNPAVKVPQHHQPDIGAIKSVSTLEPIRIDLFECFKMILHTQIIRRVPRFALSVDGCCHGI
jgi:hypothetical protein|tara:strand:- start:13091 stop:13375 length:285 start_codon:yes stop_codon:yes gene_type:complete